MANFSVTPAVAIVQLDALTALFEVGGSAPTLVTYDGPMPTRAIDSLTGSNNVLSTHPLTDPTAWAIALQVGFDAQSIAALITTAQAVATSTMTFFRCYDGNGLVLCQGDAGTGTESLTLNQTGTTSGIDVAINSLTITQPTLYDV